MEFRLLTQFKQYMTRSCFHTTCIDNSSRQVGNAMRKILGDNRKKKFHYSDIEMPTLDNFSRGQTQKKPHNSRRITVLNKLFMKHITDQMATGECAFDILGHGIEINRVKIAPDFKILNVFWTASGGTGNDDRIEQILKRNSGILRHELSQLRVMGNVPIIQFVKDKQYGHMRDIDTRLAIADFGEDYVPVDPSTKFQVETAFFLSLEDDIKQRIHQLEKHHPEEDEESPIPPMPQDTLGLDHADIMNRIKSNMKKSEASHRFGDGNDNCDSEDHKSWAKFKVNQTVNNDPVSLGNNRSQRSEAFREFLLQRQLLKRKVRENKNYIPDLEYIREELSASRLNDLNRFEMSEIPDDDFVIEDDEQEE